MWGCRIVNRLLVFRDQARLGPEAQAPNARTGAMPGFSPADPAAGIAAK